MTAAIVAVLSLLGYNVNQTGKLDLPKAQVPVQPGFYQVTHVNDGDTIVVNAAGKSETVRFIGVDTPETKDPRKPVQCYGEQASQHTHSILEGSQVRLEADPQDSDRDKYGRWLRYVYLPDGTLYNAQLISQGYGFAYVVFPFSKLDEFRALETAAREQGRGLWGGCNINDSQKIKQTTNTK